MCNGHTHRRQLLAPQSPATVVCHPAEHKHNNIFILKLVYNLQLFNISDFKMYSFILIIYLSFLSLHFNSWQRFYGRMPYLMLICANPYSLPPLHYITLEWHLTSILWKHVILCCEYIQLQAISHFISMAAINVNTFFQWKKPRRR